MNKYIDIVSVDSKGTRIAEQAYSCDFKESENVFDVKFYVINTSDDFLNTSDHLDLDPYRDINRLTYFRKEKLKLLNIEKVDFAGFGFFPQKAYCFYQRYNMDFDLINFSISKVDDVRAKNYTVEKAVRALCNDESKTLKNTFLMAQMHSEEKDGLVEHHLHHFVQKLTEKALRNYAKKNKFNFLSYDYKDRLDNGEPKITRFDLSDSVMLFSAPYRKPGTDVNLEQFYHHHMTGEPKCGYPDIALIEHSVQHFLYWKGYKDKEVTELEYFRRQANSDPKVSETHKDFLNNMTEKEYWEMVDRKAKELGLDL